MNNVVTVPAGEGTLTAAPGSVLIVRHQEWPVTNIEKATRQLDGYPGRGVVDRSTGGLDGV